uniref:RNA polymerase II assembly factor Rtp1 C-terminal domain-containing protein n=1 Tax=Panagrolaimus superbus TaxID=310955 RepID=A0A914YWC7_9BILA
MVERVENLDVGNFEEVQRQRIIEMKALLASPKGLSKLLLYFNDFGGESFWNNTIPLSCVATLLSTKPPQEESYQKYTLSIFSQFLDIMKNSKFGSNLSLLFVLTVDKLYAKAPHLVEVQLVDKIIRPWELLLERGIENSSTKENGFWNANLDGSLVILKSWLSAQPQQYSIKKFSFANRFLKLVPLFLHLCGQASASEELKDFCNDLCLILTRLLNEDMKESEVLMKHMLNDGNKTHGYFKISPEKKSVISEVKEGALTIKYRVNLEILDDHLDEETLLDLKIDSFRLIVKSISTEDAIKCLVVLISDCLNAWVSNDSVINLEENSLRFVPELETHIAEHSKRLKAVYILCSVVDILTSIEADFPSNILTDMINIAMKLLLNANQRLSSIINVDVVKEENKDLKNIEAQTTILAVGLVSAILANGMNDDSLKYRLQDVGKEMNNFCKTFQKLSDNTFIDLYKSAYESCEQLLELFSNDLHWDISTAAPESKKVTPKRSKRAMNKIEEWKLSLDGEEEDAIKGGVLIEISQALRCKDKNIFSNSNDFEWVWKVALDNAINPDSYVFLASVNVLAELSYWQNEIFLPRLVECFTSWDDSNLSKDVSLMWKCKLGEALAKVFKQIGNFSVIYFDQFSNSLLHLTKAGDELIRSSALSSFADLIMACRGRKYDDMIQELLLLVSQYLKDESTTLVRRAAIHLLRCLLFSADDNLLTIFSDTIRDVHRMLKRIWLHDQDDVVRFHAELALIDLKSIMHRLFENIMDNNFENKENCESVNTLQVPNTIDYEIKHRNVHVEDWSHEIGDQTVIDSQNSILQLTTSLPPGPKPNQGKQTFTRKSNNQPKRNRSRNHNRQPNVQYSNSSNFEPIAQPSKVPLRRTYVPSSHNNRQSSEHSQSRQRQPPVYNANAQTSRSASSSQTFTLMSRNPESHIQVTIPSTSNDVRFDHRFNNQIQSFIPRQVFSGRNDSIKPPFPHGKHKKPNNDQQHNFPQGKRVIQRNDRPKNPVQETAVTSSTSQVYGKQSVKPCQKDLKEKMPPKPVNNEAKEKVELPSTSKVDVKPPIKKSNPFGDAKPIDTSKKLIEIEQKKLAEQKKLSEKKKLEEEKKIEEQKNLKEEKKKDEEKDDIPAEEISELLDSISNRSRRNSF